MNNILCQMQQKAKGMLQQAVTIMIMPLLLAIGPIAAKAKSPQEIEKNLDAFIEKLQTELNVLPGISIAIVHKDQILLTKGYGVGDIETNAPFKADTYTYIASGTKALLGLSIATLAERGELDLDAPIGATYLQHMDQDNLGLFASVTLKQLLTHSHGLNGDAIGFRTAYTGDITSHVIWDLLGKLEASDKGTVFQYSNFGYVAAAYVLEQIYGENWQTLVERTILAPAGMRHTTARISDLLGRDYARPHRWMGSTGRVPLYKRDNSMHAAGGHFTTANDMARWLLLNLNDGMIDGQQVVPASAVRLSHAPLVAVEKTFYDFKRESHGLGWYDADYEGQRLFHHFGAYTGYRAHISMMPAVGLGVSVLSNDMSPPSFNLPDMIAAYVYDIAQGKPGVAQKYDQKIAAIAKRMAPYVGRSRPARPRNAPENELILSGLYENDIFGVWELRADKDKLRLHWGNSISDLTYVDRDGEKMLRFEVAGNGYLARPVRGDKGIIEGFVFGKNHLFKRKLH